MPFRSLLLAYGVWIAAGAAGADVLEAARQKSGYQSIEVARIQSETDAEIARTQAEAAVRAATIRAQTERYLAQQAADAAIARAKAAAAVEASRQQAILEQQRALAKLSHESSAAPAAK